MRDRGGGGPSRALGGSRGTEGGAARRVRPRVGFSGPHRAPRRSREAGVSFGVCSAARRTSARRSRGPLPARLPEPPVSAPSAAAVAAAPDPGVLDTLAEEITTLAAHIHAATHRLLTLLAEFDRLRGWEVEGHTTCAHWLAYRTGIDLGAAREKVRAARALETLPETSAAMARGALSFSKVRALTRVATPDNELELLELADGATAAQVERMVRGWKRAGRRSELEEERVRQARRSLSVFPGDDGMCAVRGVLPPEVGALLMRAIEAASDVLYRQERAAGGEIERTPEQRRADALALLVERALAMRGSAEGSAGESGRAEPISGSRAARYQVVLHVDAATLSEGGEPGRSELEDGTRVSAETSRRVACDAAVVRVTHRPDGSVLDVGRRTRTVPPAIRRALEVRDRGCRFPGCGSRFTDAHHVRHWADGGPTSLENVVLLCRAHHTLVHEGGWRVGWDDQGRPVFMGPGGRMSYDARWRGPELPADPVHMLVAAHEEQGVRPDWGTAGARRWVRAAPSRIPSPAPAASLGA